MSLMILNVTQFYTQRRSASMSARILKNTASRSVWCFSDRCRVTEAEIGGRSHRTVTGSEFNSATEKWQLFLNTRPETSSPSDL